MAEYVNLRTEDMIPELEKMEELQLFEKHEIRTIAKKRKEFEYKIQRRTKSKEDYLRYIQYEMDVLKLLRKRKEKMGTVQKKSDIEYVLAHRLQRLFKAAVQKFKSDVRIWISYFKFCKQMRFQALVGRVLMDMLQVHSDKANLWSLAANWEFNENHSVENARQFLLRGLRFHPKSKELYTEAFRLELQYAAMKRKQQQAKRDSESKKNTIEGSCANANSGKEPVEGGQHKASEDVSDQVLEGRLAEMIFESAAKKIEDVKFIIELLSTATEYDFTAKLQSKIAEFMILNYNDDELTWDTMARRELDGKPYSSSVIQSVESNSTNPPGTVASTEDNPKNTKNNCLKERIKSCISVYDAILKQLPTERMWSLYLEMLLELNHDQTHLPKYKKNLLRDAFQGAHHAGRMQEKYYLFWVDMLKSSGKLKKLEGVLRTATDRIPSSIELWQVRLQLHLARDDERIGFQVFREAVHRLGGDNKATLTLWKMMLQYYHTKEMHKVEQIFEEGIVQGPQISYPLKPMYIEWLVLAKGIVAARKMYDTMSIQPPLCLELHSKMAALECIQPDVNLKQVRRCHEMACDQFGKNNTDVWMEYVKFEQKYGDAKRVSDIYMRAVKNLDTLLTDSFISEFSMVKTGMIIPMDQSSA